MTLLPADLDQIGVYIKSNLPVWMAELQIGHNSVAYELEMRERIVRVEEELRHQRELMQQGFQQMDKRFESLTRRIDRFMIWSFGLTVTMSGVVIAVLKFS
jgi:hypothetical protein